MFEGSKLKIKRANHHIQQLASTLEAFVNLDPYTLLIEKHSGDQDYRLIASLTKQLPEDVPLILGDAAHNLRSALDLLYCDVIRLAGKDPRWGKFPIPWDGTKDRLVTTIKKGELKTANPAVADLITNLIQPYSGGYGSLLVDLHNLDIQDKHLLVIPVFMVAAIDGLEIAGNGIKFNLNGQWSFTGNEALFPVGYGAEVQVTRHGQTTCEICFAKGQPFESQSVVPTLHQLSQFVSDVVQIVEHACQPPMLSASLTITQPPTIPFAL